MEATLQTIKKSRNSLFSLSQPLPEHTFMESLLNVPTQPFGETQTHSHNTLSFPCAHSYLHAPSPHIHRPSLHTLLVPLTSCYRHRRKRRAQDTQWGHCAPGGAFGGRSSGLINRTKEGNLFPWISLIFLPGLGAGVNSRPWGFSNLGGLKVMKETGWGQSKKANGAVLEGKGRPQSRGYSPALPGRAVPVWTRLELKAHANKEERAFCLQ